MMLVDTHCHLWLHSEPNLALERAMRAGVGRVVVPGIDLETSRLAIQLAEEHEQVFAAVGIHPHNASDCDDAAVDRLRELSASDRVVAIGEIGLDFYRDHSPRKSQRFALEAQLELAREAELPVIVHNRESDEELFQDLLEWAPNVPRTLQARVGVLHAYSSDEGNAKAAIDAGFFIGVAGPVTYPNANPLRNAIEGLPRQRLVLETDTPYLPPQPHRGKQNEPAYLPIIAEKLSAVIGGDLDKIAADTSSNAARLFAWNNGNPNGPIS